VFRRLTTFSPARRYASAAFAVIACLSVLLSVTSRYYIETAKRRISKTTPHDGPGTLVLWCKTSPRNSDWITPIRVPNAVGIGKKLHFSTDRSRSLRLRCLTAENLYPSATVVRVHDGALAEEYTVSSTTLVVVEVC